MVKSRVVSSETFLYLAKNNLLQYEPLRLFGAKVYIDNQEAVPHKVFLEYLYEMYTEIPWKKSSGECCLCGDVGLYACTLPFYSDIIVCEECIVIMNHEIKGEA